MLLFIIFSLVCMRENLLCRHHRPFAILCCTLSCALVIAKEMMVLKFLFFEFVFLCTRCPQKILIEFRSLFDRSASGQTFFSALFVLFFAPVSDVFFEPLLTFPLQRMTTLDQIFPLSANMWINLRGWCPSG